MERYNLATRDANWIFDHAAHETDTGKYMIRIAELVDVYGIDVKPAVKPILHGLPKR